MQVSMEIEVPTKSVLDDHNKRSNFVYVPHPLLYHFAGEDRQITEEQSVFLKEGGKNPWHRKDNAAIWHIGKLSPLVT